MPPAHLTRLARLAVVALAAACGGADAKSPETADTASPTPPADAPANAAPDTAASRGTATVRITGGPKAVAGDFPAASCADPMASMGDVRTGVVYTAVAGAHRIVVSDPAEQPQPGPQKVAGITGGQGATVFNVNSATNERQGFVLDTDRAHAVTFGPGLKTAEASGTFLDVQGSGAMVPYAVTVRFVCK